MKIKRLFCDPETTLATLFITPLKDFYFRKTGRIFGCQSSNHSLCRGELWICERCGKRICYEEGSNDLPDICDDCWVSVRIHKANWDDENSLENV
jgi:hypothetical protein